MILLFACQQADSAKSETGDSPADSDSETLPPEADRSLASAATTITGVSSSATGNALALGDFDGDGLADLAVAAYYIDRTCLFAGPIGAGDHGTEDAAACLSGENLFDYSGYGLGAVGDLDGDGVEDLLVGAIGNDDVDAFAGKAYLVPGGVSGDVNLGEMAAAWTGEAAADYFGTTVAAAGDATGDGRDDALIAAPGVEAGSGRVYLVPGGAPGGSAGELAWAVTGEADSGTSALWHGETAAGDRLGDGAAGGDIDGDGISDLGLGGTGSDRVAANAGALAVFYGPLSSGRVGFADADAVVEGVSEGDYLGAPVQMDLDIDGDGRRDLAFAADGVSTATGRVYAMTEAPAGVLSADEAPIQVTGEVIEDEAGRDFAFVADIDLDGAADLVVGAPSNDTTAADSGAAYLLLGPFAGAHALGDADVRWRAEAEGDAAGRSTTGGADLDGDGQPDLAVGAIYSDAGGSFSGRVYVLGF